MLASASGFLVLLIGLQTVGGLAWANARLRAEVERADRNARESDRLRRLAEEPQDHVDHHSRESARLSRLAEDRGDLANHYIEADRIRRACQALADGRTEWAQDILHGGFTDSARSLPPDFCSSYLNRLAERDFIQLRGHGQSTIALTITSDGRTLATGEQSGAILLWDTRQNRPIHHLRGQELPAAFLAFSPDGTRLASGGRHESLGNSEVLLWEVSSGRLLCRLDPFHSREILWLAFLDGGSALAVYSRRAMQAQELQLFELSSATKAPRLKRVLKDVHIPLPSKGRFPAFLSRDRGYDVQFLDPATWKPVAKTNLSYLQWPERYWAGAISADGSALAVFDPARSSGLGSANWARVKRLACARRNLAARDQPERQVHVPGRYPGPRETLES